mmetsp:Transcript_48937/g.98468  ORF Transcript_48937/g.98468 Transcript_48937/m.98468 type:complete len:435 (+) Transcript_48937:70-1374(+)
MVLVKYLWLLGTTALALTQPTALLFDTPCNLMADFSAYGDGIHLDDEALTHALSACSSIVFPAPGRYLVSAFNMSSNQELVVEAGATLLASTLDLPGWPLVQSYPSYEPGYPTVLNRPAPFIGAPNASNVRLRGGGTIDGQGAAWWGGQANGSALPYVGRPRLVEPSFCTNFSMLSLSIVDPPFWAVHPYACRGVLLQDLIFTAPLDSPNTDGLDPDSCQDVVIRNFTCVSGGDDAIAIKSGKDEWGRAFGMPSANVLIEGGTIGPSRGINIGSEMSGGVANVTVRQVHFFGSEFAVRVKAARGRGGTVQGVAVEDCTVSGVTEAVLAVNMDYGSTAPPALPGASTTPRVRNLSVARVAGSALGAAGVLRCLAESPCRGVVLEDLNLTLARRQGSGSTRNGTYGTVRGWACERVFGSSAGTVVPDASTCLNTRY